MITSHPSRSRLRMAAALTAVGGVDVLVSGWLVSTLRSTSGPGELVVGLVVTGLVVAAQLRYLRAICRGWPATTRSGRRRAVVDAVVVPLTVPLLVPLGIVAALVELGSRVRSSVRGRPAADAPAVPEQRRCSPTPTGDVTVG